MAGMWTEDQELMHDFLVESDENLARMDQDMVALNSRPKDERLLGNIFRTIHTIKGASGLLDLHKLEAVALPAENLLGQVRDGRRDLDAGLVSLTCETVSAIRAILAEIQSSGQEGPQQFEDLIQRLQAAGNQS